MIKISIILLGLMIIEKHDGWIGINQQVYCSFPIPPVLCFKNRARFMHHHRVPCPKRNLHAILPLAWAEPYAIPLKDINFHTVRQHSSAIPHYRAAAVLLHKERHLTIVIELSLGSITNEKHNWNNCYSVTARSRRMKLMKITETLKS